MQEEKEKGIMTDRQQVEETPSVLARGGDVEVTDEAKVCEMNQSKEGGRGDDGNGDNSLSFGGGGVQSENMGEDLVSVEAATAPQLSRKELLEAVGAQLEELFSLSSLKAGTFPAGNMNAQMCVPVDVMAQMSQIKAITMDEDVILEAAETNSACIVTPNGIRPNVRSERNTIILRDIPSNTDSRRVAAIFKDAGMKLPITVRADIGDTWFVTFKTEDDAMKSILELRAHVFEGKPIKARLKSENLLRSIFPQTSTNASGNNVVLLNPTTVPPSVINPQQQASFLPPGAANNPQAAIPPAVMAPYPMGSGPAQPQIGSLFTGQMNRGLPSSFSPGINSPFSAGLNNPRPLPPGNTVMQQGGMPVGTYPSPVMDPYTMHNLLSYNMIPQQPLMRQWRGRMGGAVNDGLHVGQSHNQHASLGTINVAGGIKNGGRGRHFPNASMPNMFRPPAGIFFNPMPGYGSKNANNKAQPYQQFSQQYGAGVQATDSRDRTTIPSRGLKSRNRGRGGHVVDRGGRTHVVGDTEIGGSGKLRGGNTFSNDKAKQPDLSSSAHFPPLPGQYRGGDAAGVTDNSKLGGGLGTQTPGGARHLTDQSTGEVSPTLSSLSDGTFIEISNESGGAIGGGCVEGSGVSESVLCAPTSCSMTTSNSSASANGGSGGGGDNLSHGSKIGQSKRVEGDLGLEVSAASAAATTSSSTSGDKTIPQADGTSFNLQVYESMDQSERVDIVSHPSQEGSSTQTNPTTAATKQTEQVKSIESPPVFGAYAAALMKKYPIKASKPDSKISPGKTSTGKPSGTKSTKDGDAAVAGTFLNVHDQSSSYITSEENRKRDSNDKKGQSRDSSKSTKSRPTSEQFNNTVRTSPSLKNRNGMDVKESVASGGATIGSKTCDVPAEESDGAIRDHQGNRINISQSVEASGTSRTPQLVASSFCDPAPNSASVDGSAWGKRSFLDAVMAQPPQKSA